MSAFPRHPARSLRLQVRQHSVELGGHLPSGARGFRMGRQEHPRGHHVVTPATRRPNTPDSTPPKLTDRAPVQRCTIPSLSAPCAASLGFPSRARVGSYLLRGRSEEGGTSYPLRREWRENLGVRSARVTPFPAHDRATPGEAEGESTAPAPLLPDLGRARARTAKSATYIPRKGDICPESARIRRRGLPETPLVVSYCMRGPFRRTVEGLSPTYLTLKGVRMAEKGEKPDKYKTEKSEPKPFERGEQMDKAQKAARHKK